MILLYLLLGHFIADFLLQPNSLVAWKNRSWHGVLVHVIIHFLVTGLLLYLYSQQLEGWGIAFSIAFCHFFLDLFKASHQSKSKHALLAYWSDQILHYTSITIVFYSSQSLGLTGLNQFSNNSLYQAFVSPFVLIYLSASIFITLTIEYSFYRDRQKFTKISPTLNCRHLVTRLFLFTLIYLGLLFSLPAASALIF